MRLWNRNLSVVDITTQLLQYMSDGIVARTMSHRRDGHGRGNGQPTSSGSGRCIGLFMTTLTFVFAALAAEHAQDHLLDPAVEAAGMMRTGASRPHT